MGIGPVEPESPTTNWTGLAIFLLVAAAPAIYAYWYGQRGGPPVTVAPAPSAPPPEASAGPIEVGPGPAVESKLPLRLIGTLVLKDEKQSVAALWSDDRKDSFPLRADDLLLPYIQMKKVEGTRVEFVNISGKRLEFLLLSPGRVRRTGESKSLEAAEKEDAKPVTIARTEIVGCVQGGGACLKDALALPYFVDGKLLGWRIRQIKAGSLFAKLGFQEDDVILSANGEGVTDVSRIPYWMMQIVSVKSVDLGILRDGRPVRIDYQVKD